MSARIKTSLPVLFSSFAAIFGPRSSRVTWSPPRNVLPSRVTATTIASSLLASSITTAASAFGRSTLTLLFSIGVMTMKMISNTNITSTIGVTLMLELTFLPSSRLLIPITYTPSGLLCLLSRCACPASGCRSLRRPEGPVRSVILAGYYRVLDVFRRRALPMALLDEVVHQFARAIVHLDVKRFNLAGEVVERHNGGDSNKKTESRRHQSFRNTTGDCADTGGLLRCNLLECI